MKNLLKSLVVALILISCGDGRLSPQGGTIVGVVAGNGLTGGAMTGIATLNVACGYGLTCLADSVAVDTTVMVDGTGTLNYLPRWTPDGSTLGNSLWTDNGTTTTYNTDKFTVASATGNTVIAGTLEVQGSTLWLGADYTSGTVNITGDTNVYSEDTTVGFAFYVDQEGTGIAAGREAAVFLNHAGYNTTALSLDAYAVDGRCNSTREAGANALYCIGGSFTAYGTDAVNVALQTLEGDVFLNAGVSGKTGVGYPHSATLTSQFNVNGSTLLEGALTVEGNASIGDAPGDAHTLLGTLNANATAGSGTDVLTIVSGLPKWASSLTLAGTLTLSPMTSGSVLFAGTAGLVSQDNANFFWDDSNNRLGIATAGAPSKTLHIGGDVAVTGSSSILTVGATDETKTNFNPGVEITKAGDVDLVVSSYGTSTSAQLLLFRGRGTAGSTSVVQSGDQLGQVAFTGATSSTAFFSSALIRGVASQTFNATTDFGGSLEFYTTTNGGGSGGRAVRLTIANDGVATFTNNVVISSTSGVYVQAGSSSPTKSGLSALAEFTRDAASATMVVSSYGTGVNPQFYMLRGRGTGASSSAVQSGDALGTITFAGLSSATGTLASSFISASATENWGAGAGGSRLTFTTDLNTTTTRLVKFAIENDGGITLTNSASAAVSAASSLTLRYQTSGDKLQLSANTGAYVDVLTSSTAGVGVANTIPKWTAASALGISLLTDNATTLAYNTNKFTVASSTGNTVVAGTLDVTGLVTATAGGTTPANWTTTGTGDLVSADDLTVADDATITDALLVQGNMTSGDAAGDVFDHNGSLAKFGATDGLTYLNDASLNFAYATNATASGYISWTGYNNGTTQFRDTVFGDGKQNVACTLTGSTKTLNCVGGLQVNGTSVVTTASVSGTTNTIAMFTGANAVGNSSLVYNGTQTLTWTKADSGSHANRPIVAITNSETTGGFGHRAELQFNIYDSSNVSRQISLLAEGKAMTATFPASGGYLEISAGATNGNFGSANSGLRITDTLTTAQGVGGGISFYGAYSGTSTTVAATIKAAKTNSTGGHAGFDLALGTRLDGSSETTEHMRIKDTGALQIGDVGTSSVENNVNVASLANTGTGNTTNALKILSVDGSTQGWTTSVGNPKYGYGAYITMGNTDDDGTGTYNVKTAGAGFIGKVGLYVEAGGADEFKALLVGNGGIQSTDAVIIGGGGFLLSGLPIATDDGDESLYVGSSATSIAFDYTALSATPATTHDTTAGALNSYAVYGVNTASRSAGANALTNYGGYFSASGGQSNYALYTGSGSVYFNGTTTVNAAFTADDGTAGITLGSATVTINADTSITLASVDVNVPGAFNGYTQVTQAADQDVTNLGLTDSNTLTITTTAGKIYAIDALIIAGGNNTTGDYLFDFAVAAGTMDCTGTEQSVTTADAIQNTTVIATAAADTADTSVGTRADASMPIAVRITLACKVSNTTTLKYRFGNASASAGRTSRTMAGSYIRWKQLN